MVRLGEKEMGVGTRRLAVELVWSQVASARWTVLKIYSLLLFIYQEPYLEPRRIVK